MYISKVFLKNVRCCNKLTIDFNNHGSSILFCGDNGDGKSTILRCIAMGLCDQTSAAGLLRELSGDFVRKGKEKEASITIELVDSQRNTYKIETTIKSLEAFESLTQEVYVNGKKSDQQNFPWHKIFVAAYGPGNRITGTADYQHYVAVDAVYSLFKNDVPLQNPELVFRRAIDEAHKRYKKDSQKAKKYAEKTFAHLRKLLETLLNLDDKDRIFLTKTGLEVKSKRWGRAELGALGDGYRSTTTWVLDLISWWMLQLEKKSFLSNRKVKGIVLIDEVEQHLHPKWQIKIMQLLQGEFNEIQFIATTHSPLVISGCKEIPVYILSKGKHKQKHVYGWLAEDVYREIMGLESSRAELFNRDIRDYEELHYNMLKKKMSPKDKYKLKKFKKEFKTLPGTDPIVITTELDNLTKSLESIEKKVEK